MAKRTPPPPPPSEFDNIADIDRAITKLTLRHTELTGLRGIRHDDPRVENAEHNVRRVILEVFGEGSPEYERHRYFKLEKGSVVIGMDDEDWQDNFERGLAAGVSLIENFIGIMREKRTEISAAPTAQAHAAFKGRTLHVSVIGSAEALYRDGHYAQAVFDAAKALVDLVKQKSGRADLDGAPLMRAVFSKNNPILAFNELKDQTDGDEQEGMMHLFEGAVQAVRNPRGHKPGIADTAERALQYLELLSLLADRLEETQKRP